MKGFVVAIVSIVAGYFLATALVVALHIAGLNIPAALARTYSQYSTYAGAEVFVYMIGISFVMYRVLARRFLPRPLDNRPWLERLPRAVRHPSVVGLAVAWVAGVFTGIGYIVAIYMSWRYYVMWRDTGTKVCPRCAERIRAAALVCRHCSQPFPSATA